jgi:hypothetical protein
VGSEAPCWMWRERVSAARLGRHPKVGEDHKKREPEFSIARAAWGPVRVGMVSGSVIGSSGPGACMDSVELVGGFWAARVLYRERTYSL